MSKSKSPNNKFHRQLTLLIVIILLLLTAFIGFRLGSRKEREIIIQKLQDYQEKNSRYSCQIFDRRTGQTLISLFTKSKADCDKLGEILSTPIVQQSPVYYLAPPLPEQPRSGREIWEDIEQQQFRQKASQFFDKFLYGF